MVLETGSWWLAHQVLIAPQWIREVRWSDESVAVNLTQQSVKSAPPYDSSAPPSREQEIHLFRHHGRAGYWADEVRLENPEYHVITPAAQASISKTRERVTRDTRHSS